MAVPGTAPEVSRGSHAWPSPSDRSLDRSHFALLRFIAGMRALFALLAGIAMISHGIDGESALAWVLLTYLLLAVALLVRTLGGWPLAGAAQWLWIDAAAIAIVCRLQVQDAPWLGIVSVVPVVAMSVLAGARHGLVLALASAG